MVTRALASVRVSSRDGGGSGGEGRGVDHVVPSEDDAAVAGEGVVRRFGLGLGDDGSLVLVLILFLIFFL